MITLSEARANIGNKVLYRPSSGAPPDEEGVITSVKVGDGWVFVRYAADAGSQATRPDDLTLLAPPEPSFCRHGVHNDAPCQDCAEDVHGQNRPL